MSIPLTDECHKQNGAAAWSIRVPPTGGLWCPEEARQALTALADPAAGIELMRLPGGQRVSLPGNDVAGLVRQAERWADGAAGLYYSLGTVDPALARPARVGDVLRRRWLLVDLDPRRPRDVSATDAEHESARLLALQVLDGLAGLGWPAPVLVDSGNGFHLLYRVDLANDETTRPLVMRVLRAVKGLYETDAVEIDDKVGNANRHGKLPGCWARKGPDAADRPHRPCRLVHLPGRVEVVGRELLEELAGPEPKRPDPAAFRLHVPPGNRYGAVALDREVGRLLLAEQRNNALNAAAFNLYRLAAGGVLTEGEVTARLTDAALSVGLPAGEVAATLASARGKGLTLPRGIPDRPDNQRQRIWQNNSIPQTAAPQSVADRPPENGRVTTGERRDDEGASLGWRYSPVDHCAFMAGDYSPRWLVRGLIVDQQPAVIGGPSKCMKTSVALDLAVSLASGTPFLGRWEVAGPVRTCVLSGESGQATLQETARRVCRSKGIDPAAPDLLWQFDLPQLANPEHLVRLAGGLRRDGVRAVLIDPLYLSLLSGAVDVSASNLYQIGPLLLGVARACLDAGAVPFLLHHTNKAKQSTYDPLSLSDLAYSGIAEFARQWLLLSRRERYAYQGEHRLWLSAGGSCGQGRLYALDIEEGVIDDDFGGRIWRVEARDGEEERRECPGADTAEARARKEQEDDLRFMNALDRLDPAGEGVSFRQTRIEAGMNPDRAGAVLARLKAAGLVVTDQGPRGLEVRRTPVEFDDA